ncbi:MAG: hypothetical protein A2089_10415 [Elusimicrobia bacterium GWD2_63_28]|nr:MAG: hypothetical protein A2089_10415 [Elusimicrobia bacterium GWD2_63_28]
MKETSFNGLCQAAAAALCLCAPPLKAGELAVVLSSKAGPYSEAYEAFASTLKLPAELLDASPDGFEIPEDIRYAAAFGARAAALNYPPGTRLVYALAPVAPHGPGWHEISMAPPPEAALEAYKTLQPGLKRLAVFWAAYPGERYIADLRKAGDKAGIEIISARLKNPESLPDRLRRLMGKMDAFWLLPDPALITPSSIMLLADFSCSNAIPFYAPTHALMLNGAAASFAPDFAQSGAAAARVLAAMRGGARVPSVTYPENTVLRVNEALRGKCNWPLAKK